MRLIASQYGRIDGGALRAATLNPLLWELPPQELYGLLWRYYAANGVYDDLTAALRELNRPAEDIRELRNPAHRAVEFHVAKMFPGTLPSALPILAPNNRRIITPIQKIWRWSNFSMTKQRLVRFCGVFGDAFVKVAERDDPLTGRHVFLQVLDPRWVTDFSVNEQGDVTYIRIEVPQTAREYRRGPFGVGGRTVRKAILYTEIWDTERVRIFRYPTGAMRREDRDAIPAERDEAHGLGFVPVVWAPFTDIGEGRGMGVFTHALPKIDEANRVATRLHALLFRNNNNNWVLRANQIDATGRPLPPPRLDGLNGTSSDDQSVQIGEERIWRLPGQSELQSIIPSIDYNAALAILNAQLEELRNDLPELRYYDSTAKSHVSGAALRAALSDAVDRVIEARGYLEGALMRAHGMALHLAQRARLPGYLPEQIGTLGAGDFEHQFADRPVFPLTSMEQASAVQAWVQAGVPMPVALMQEGWTEDEVKEIERAQVRELKRQADMRQQEAEALTKLPLTDEQIATTATAYVKNVGVPPALALERLGWTMAWIRRLEEAMATAQEEAKTQQDEEQQKALEMQKQQQAEGVAIQQEMQAQQFAQQQQLQQQKLDSQKEIAQAKLGAQQQAAAEKAAAQQQATAQQKPPKADQGSI